jgi:four helix bundle protein
VAGVRDYRDLEVWKLADEVRRRIRDLTGRPAFRDHLWLRTQLRKAANSACANTGEGFSRYHPRQFASFLNISKASLSEICDHLDDVVGLGLADPNEAAEIREYARRARGAATALVRYLD